MRELFRNDLPLAQLVLRIITGIEDLELTSQETQYDLKRLLGSRSICLDVFGTDSMGRQFDLEQIAEQHHKEQDIIQVPLMQSFSKRKISLKNYRFHTLFS